MTNAMEARKFANEFKANEIAKMNEYAALHAEHIGEEIAAAAKKGKTQIEVGTDNHGYGANDCHDCASAVRLQDRECQAPGH